MLEHTGFAIVCAELQLTAEAIKAALDDCGLKPSDVDGMTTFTLDTTDEIEAAREKVLVFTQFREMGELLQRWLRERQGLRPARRPLAKETMIN